MEKRIMAFDAETNGLWGQIFAIGAVLTDLQGYEISHFYGAIECADPIEWVAQNVVPVCPVTHENYSDLIADFSAWYMENKEHAYIVAHMGYIVEAKLLREMHRLGGIGDWDGPFPMHDTATLLLSQGFDPKTEMGYLKGQGIACVGHEHDPLSDASNTAVTFSHLLQKTQQL